MRPLILVTNDDGIRAKGLATLIDIAEPMGNLLIIAPEEGHSAQSHAITVKNPIRIRTIQAEESKSIYACSGTPADCVKFAVAELCKNRKPDLIVSGINHGLNNSISVLYSGTVAAAMEGLLFGINAIALSLDNHSAEANFEICKDESRKIIKKVLQYPADKKKVCLNVNFPNIEPKSLKGIRWCRQTQGDWKEIFIKREDPLGHTYYWLTGEFRNFEQHAEDSDDWALNNGYASIVPVANDLTDYQAEKSWFL